MCSRVLHRPETKQRKSDGLTCSESAVFSWFEQNQALNVSFGHSSQFPRGRDNVAPNRIFTGHANVQHHGKTKN